MQFQLGPKLQQSPVPRLIINDTPESLNLITAQMILLFPTGNGTRERGQATNLDKMIQSHPNVIRVTEHHSRMPAVTRSPLNTAYVPAGVTWSLSGDAETLAVSQTTVVSVNGETFSLTRIPFEPRPLAGHTPLREPRWTADVCRAGLPPTG